MSSKTHARSAPSRGRKVSQKKPYYRGGGKDDENSLDLKVEQAGGGFDQVKETEIAALIDGIQPGKPDILFVFKEGTDVSSLGQWRQDAIKINNNAQNNKNAVALNLEIEHNNELKNLLNEGPIKFLDELSKIYLRAGADYVKKTDDSNAGYNVLILPFTILKQNKDQAQEYEDEYMLYLLSHCQDHSKPPADNGVMNDAEKSFYNFDVGKNTDKAWRPFFCNYDAENNKIRGFLNKNIKNQDVKKTGNEVSLEKNLLHHVLCYTTGHEENQTFENDKILIENNEICFNMEMFKIPIPDLGAWADLNINGHKFLAGGDDKPLLVISYIIKGDIIAKNDQLKKYVLPIKNKTDRPNNGHYEDNNNLNDAGNVAFVPIAYLRGNDGDVQNTLDDKTIFLSVVSDEGSPKRVGVAIPPGNTRDNKETPYEFLLKIVGGKLDNLPKILQDQKGFKINGTTHDLGPPAGPPAGAPAGPPAGAPAGPPAGAPGAPPAGP